MEQLTLFDNRETSNPLASRMRPESLAEFTGQKHLLGEEKLLRKLIERALNSPKGFGYIQVDISKEMLSAIAQFASEDVGLADSNALQVAVAAYQASHFIGMPECSVNLSHAVVYLSTAPKSNALYAAYEQVKTDALERLAEPVPLWLRNAPTRLMEDLHYGEGYQYAHNTEEKLTLMECMPESLKGRTYYRPTSQGQEKHIKERLKQIQAWKNDNSLKNKDEM